MQGNKLLNSSFSANVHFRLTKSSGEFYFNVHCYSICKGQLSIGRIPTFSNIRTKLLVVRPSAPGNKYLNGFPALPPLLGLVSPVPTVSNHHTVQCSQLHTFQTVSIYQAVTVSVRRNGTVQCNEVPFNNRE